MNKVITGIYDKREILSSIKRYWMNTSGWFFIGLAVALMFIVVSLVLFSGDQGLVGFTGGAFFMTVLGGYWSYTGTVQRAIIRLNRLSSLEVTFRLTEENFSYDLDQVAGQMAWSLVDGLHKYPNIWLLCERNQPVAMLPVNILDEEARQFITVKVKKNNGEVR